MAVSDVDIANLALIKCGANVLTGFSDNKVEGTLATRTYAMYRDQLQRWRWNFNRKYVVVAARAGYIPPFEYAFAYPLPDDYLRVELFGQASQAAPAPPPTIPPAPYSPPPPTTFSAGPTDFGTGMPGTSLADVNNSRTQDYRLVGREIWSNQYPPGYLQYGARVTDPNMFDVFFIDTLACYLAMQWCEKLTGSAQKKASLSQEFREARMNALAAKAVELPPEQIPDDTFILSRFED